ncbi:hypothetical protein [Nocardiopsis protaetiae]|uniref:hypothetical protein n=1 Tax=Nocardiopsis protaetiae TaxID=3382270 RepID=UPI00387B7150
MNPTPRTFVPLLGALGFLIFYLAVGPVAGMFAVGDIPRPGTPAEEVYAFLTANGTASVVTAILQTLSVLGLAVVVARTVRTPSREADTVPRRVAAVAGWTAVAAMLVSAVTAVVLSVLVPQLSVEAAVNVRSVSFVTGGVVHVVALGVFVAALAGSGGWSRPVRVTAWIAAVPAVLSLVSVLWPMAMALLPLGRLLGMAALVVAGVSLVRGRSRMPREVEGVR